MDRKLINPQIVTDIANAIRAKKGTTGTINVSQLANEIATISGGGVADSTKTLIGVISGVTPTDELSTNNAIAKGATDTPSEETFTERTTADGGSIKDTIAFVDKVKGNCVKYNQYANYTANTGAGVTLTKVGDNFQVSGTSTSTSYITRFNNLISGSANHKILCVGIGSLKVRIFSNDLSSDTAFSNGEIKTITYDMYQFQLRPSTSGITYNEVICPMIFDLTAMGCESFTTADQVAKYLGYESANKLPYMSYQADTIVLANMRNLVSSSSCKKTIDLGSLSWRVANTDKFYAQVANAKVGLGDNLVCSGNYSLATGSTNMSTDKSIGFGANNNYIYVRDSAYTDVVAFTSAVTGITITYESTEYTEIDTLPINARNLVDSEGSTIFPNGMLSAGSVCDEWDMSQGVAVKKIGVVDLGSLTWNTSTIGRFISQSLRDIAKLPSDNSIKANIILSKYSTTFYNNMNSATGADNVISLTSGGNFYVRDTSLEGKTANEFKSLVNGLLLYYELATPITYNVSKAKAYYKVSQNGKEVATSTDNSAPFKADIAYRGLSAEDVINAING